MPLHTDGFQVLKGWTSITPELIAMAHTKAAEAEVIFNDNPTNRLNDANRQQVDLSTHHPVIGAIRSQLQKEHPIHSIRNFFLLVSRPGCRRQAAHTDYVPTPALFRASDTEIPLLFLLALEDDTQMEVWPQSHLVIQGRRGGPAIERFTVTINAGDAILIRGDLVHALPDRQNMHIRAYLDSSAVPRDPNRTYSISNDAAPSLRDLIEE